MKIDVVTEFSQESPEFRVVLKFKDLNQADIEALIDRSNQDLNDLGATLIANSPMAALEALLMYFAELDAASAAERLRETRKTMYPAIALSATIANYPESERAEALAHVLKAIDTKRQN